MRLDRMIEALEAVEPVELKGVELLKRLRPQMNVWFPQDQKKAPEVARTDVVYATLELIAYGDSCMRVATRLDNISAEPFDLPLVEYPL